MKQNLQDGPPVTEMTDIGRHTRIRIHDEERPTVVGARPDRQSWRPDHGHPVIYLRVMPPGTAGVVMVNNGRATLTEAEDL